MSVCDITLEEYVDILRAHDSPQVASVKKRARRHTGLLLLPLVLLCSSFSFAAGTYWEGKYSTKTLPYGSALEILKKDGPDSPDIMSAAAIVVVKVDEALDALALHLDDGGSVPGSIRVMLHNIAKKASQHAK